MRWALMPVPLKSWNRGCPVTITLSAQETAMYRDGLDGAHNLEADIIDYLSWKDMEDFCEVCTHDGQTAFFVMNGEILDL